MSGAARRRGRGRARGQADASDSSERMSVPAGGFDGPASRGSGSGTSGGRVASTGSGRGGSPQPAGGFAPQGGEARSRQSSNSGAQSQGPPLHDPALDPSRIPKATDSLKNVDLPASFFSLDRQYNVDVQFKARPGFNTTGKEVRLDLNAWVVKKFPSIRIQQYDVVIGDGAEKAIVVKKVWNSKVRRDNTGPEMIFDGNKLAWSLKAMGEMRIVVDLDAEEGRKVEPGSPRAGQNSKRLRIVPTKTLDLSVLHSYLQGQVGNLTAVGEAINFLDHLLREGPSKNSNLVALKRSFFARNGDRMDLGGSVEVFRGVYQSMRLAQGHKMVINIDVANTTFWKPSALLTALTANQKLRDPSQLQAKLRIPDVRKVVQSRFKGTIVHAKFQGNKAVDRDWKIHKIVPENAQQAKLDFKANKTAAPRTLTVEDYFKEKYNVRLQFPQLPLVEMTKKGVKYPMELLHILPCQRYGAKLDETQTANMIKFAVSPPHVRLQAIQQGKKLLDWGNDTYLKNYGLLMEENSVKTNARILPPPTIAFGPGKPVSPGTTGRWDLRGVRFNVPNPNELKAWGIGFMPGRTAVGKEQIQKFAQDFARFYRGYGGKVSNSPPHMMPLPEDPGKAVEALYQATGQQFKAKPQLMIFLLQNKDSSIYMRIKKSSDCRYGIVSQCLQLQQVLKGSPQYHGNVLMKVNAKLGGATSLVKPAATSGFKGITVPTLYIGADVSHASPGSMQPSMAAITMSFDKNAQRYAAGCQTNGHRVEMISEANWNSILTPLLKQWMAQVSGNNMPAQVYYFRDGVSEGQFSHVMQQEVAHIRRILSNVANKPWTGKLTVIVASKRHHVRAFPAKGDTSAADNRGNPLPGCLIERDVTMPNEFDFFLYSHTALQGTSRPVHYTILHDDANLSPNVIQNMIYEQCYQYMRSTTSVSLHPAVYYAHLASNRAIAHLDLPASAGPQGGPGFKQNQPQSSDAPSSEAAPLLGMENSMGIRFAMWYI